MQTQPLDLWPQDIVAAVDFRTPLSILKEQASLLGQKTQNLVEGVVTSVTNSNDTFQHMFYLAAPALSNYRYRLFTVTHEIDLYPLTIVSETGQRGARSEEEFVEQLRAIFSHDQTKKVIGALIAQSRE